MDYAIAQKSRGRGLLCRPMGGFRRFTRAGIVALAASFGLGVLNGASAQQSTGSAPGMGSMMRPDMAPPTGIIGGMSPKTGVIMPLLQFMRMRMCWSSRRSDRDVSRLCVRFGATRNVG